MPSISQIFLVDDHPIFRKGLLQLINEEEDLNVCGEAESFHDAVKEIDRCSPDLAIVDITLKDTSGLELIHHLHEKDRTLPVLVISMHDESIYTERVLRAGALGYITKQEMSQNVIKAVRQVLKGRIYVSEVMVEAMLGKMVYTQTPVPENPVESLSDRELEVFQLIGRGFSRKEIAETLHLSVKTIGSYRENIKKKLNLKNASELMKHAISWTQQQQEEERQLSSSPVIQ